MRSASLENGDPIQNSWPTSCNAPIAGTVNQWALQYRRIKNETQTKSNSGGGRAVTRNFVRNGLQVSTSSAQRAPVTYDRRLHPKTNAVRASHPDRTVFAKSCRPFPRTRHGGEQPSSPALRRVRAMMLLGRLSVAKRTSRIDLQALRWFQRPVLPCVEDS